MTIFKTNRHNFLGKQFILYILSGAAIGYFILHPLTMVIYGWYGHLHDGMHDYPFWRTFFNHIIHSFSFHMVPMSVFYIIIGSLSGLGLTIYFNTLRKRDGTQSQLSFADLKELIRNGETQTVAMLPSLRYDYRQVTTNTSIETIVIRTIAGMLNAKGGRLFIGVNKFGEIPGLANDYYSLKNKDKIGFEQRIMLIVANNLGADICSLLHLNFYILDDREICLIRISPPQRPVFVKENNNTVFYLRMGNTTKPLNTKETLTYVTEKKKKQVLNV